jgi:Spy/CpxP family protein refolding chaperone
VCAQGCLEVNVRKVFLFMAIVGGFSLSTIAWATVQPASTVKRASGMQSIDDVVKALRSVLQANRSDIIAKNVLLTSEQAAKFWPLYDAYQNEQSIIMDGQLKGMQQYVTGWTTLDDAAALTLATAHLSSDTRMATLRQKWFAEFQKILPAKLAARVMQIDRRLSLATQTEIASRIPLIH